MLKLEIEGTMEWWDEASGMFRTIKPQTLKLEHSLISVYKWESKWHKSFLSSKDLTPEEILDYFECMCVNRNDVDPLVFRMLTQEQYEKIRAYIEDPMTATTISDRRRKTRSRNIITAELIYYWMISLDIPLEFEKRHLNHLLMLIEVCDIKNGGTKKMSKKDLAKQNHALNAARKSKSGSKG